jgi:hypothetical protein
MNFWTLLRWAASIVFVVAVTVTALTTSDPSPSPGPATSSGTRVSDFNL